MPHILLSPFEDSVINFNWSILSPAWTTLYYGIEDILVNADYDSFVIHTLSSVYFLMRYANLSSIHEFLEIGLSMITANYNLMLLILCFMTSLSTVYLSKTNGFAFTFFRILYNFVHDKVISYLGEKGNRYFPVMFSLSLFIFFCNLCGLIPSIFSLTSNLSVVSFLSSAAWLSITFIGIYRNGIDFFTHLFPSKVPMHIAPLILIIESVSSAIRIASSASRLFSNIIAGHLLPDTIPMSYFFLVFSINASFSYVTTYYAAYILLFLCLIICFELIIAFPQAYISLILFIIYVSEL